MSSTSAGEPVGATEATGGRTGYREARRRLGSAQKPARGPAYSVYVNRALGRHAAAGAYVLGLTPNTVTVVSAGFSLAGIAVVALCSSWAVLAAPLLLVGFVLDSADGQLARLRDGGTAVGEWLDHIIDAVKVTSLHLAVLVHLYPVDDLSDRWLLVPLGFTVVEVTTFFGYLLHDQLVRRRVASDPTRAAASAEPTSVLRSVLQLPIDYGVLCWTFLLIAWPEPFVAVYTVLFAASGAYLVLVLGKWYRDMRAFDEVQSR